MPKISWTIKKAGSVASTEEEAKRLAKSGSPEGTVVVATDQHGKVRGSPRPSPKGGLYASIILKPDTEYRLSIMPLATAFSAAEGIRKDTGIVTRVKWPNEVLIGEKTVAMTFSGPYNDGQAPHLIVTFAVYCNLTSSDAGDGLVTTLLDELGVTVDVDMLLSKILGSIEWIYSEWKRGRQAGLAERISPTVETLGRKIELKVRGRPAVRCLAKRITDEGRLVFEFEDGSEDSMLPDAVDRLRHL